MDKFFDWLTCPAPVTDVFVSYSAYQGVIFGIAFSITIIFLYWCAEAFFKFLLNKFKTRKSSSTED